MRTMIVRIALLPVVAALVLAGAARAQQTAPARSASPDQDIAQRCTDAVHRAFDFWIGAWVVRNQQGDVIGHNDVTRVARGCGLLENWRGAGGGAGVSVNTYDAARGVWTQRWVGDGSTLWLEGGLRGEAMVLEGTAPRATPRGAVLDRITWTPLPDGGVSQVWELSTDGGATWTPSFQGIYQRAGGEGAEPPAVYPQRHEHNPLAQRQ